MNEVFQVYLRLEERDTSHLSWFMSMAASFPRWKKQYSKVIQGRLFASLLKQITLLLSTPEQLPGTHREQGFAVTKCNVYILPKSTFKMPTSWIISNLTRDVVRKITCQVDLVVVASQRWRMCDLYTETRRILIGLKQVEVNGSDRPIYFTPLTSEACGEPHSLFSVSLGHASPSLGFPFRGSQVVRWDGGRPVAT